MSSVSCTSNATSINVENVSEHACPAVHYGTPPNFPAASDLPLPIFENESENNAALHLKLLDEYFELRAIPPPLRLAIAARSLKGAIAKSWVIASSGVITNYVEFREAFLRQFWGSECQARARCSIYQGRYSRQETGTMSNHLLKFAVLAKFLHPPMDDSEFLQAVRGHFPPFVQRCWITGPIKTI
jgi:hypothetical protein